MSCSLTSPIVGLVGVIIGILIGHRLTLSRDRAARKRAFLGFLRQWHAEISLPRLGPDKLGLGINPAHEAYYSRLPSFLAEVERVRDAFSNRQRFEFLTSRLGNLKAEDWQNEQPSEVILHAVDELVRFAA